MLQGIGRALALSILESEIQQFSEVKAEKLDFLFWLIRKDVFFHSTFIVVRWHISFLRYRALFVDKNSQKYTFLVYSGNCSWNLKVVFSRSAHLKFLQLCEFFELRELGNVLFNFKLYINYCHIDRNSVPTKWNPFSRTDPNYKLIGMFISVVFVKRYRSFASNNFSTYCVRSGSVSFSFWSL